MDVHNESASQLNVANIGYQQFNFWLLLSY